MRGCGNPLNQKWYDSFLRIYNINKWRTLLVMVWNYNYSWMI